MTSLEKKLRPLSRMKVEVGLPTQKPLKATTLGPGDIDGEGFVNRLFNEANNLQRNTVKALDEAWGTDIQQALVRSVAGTPAEELIERGIMNPDLQSLFARAVVKELNPELNILPGFTSVGQLRGPAAGAQAGRMVTAGLMGAGIMRAAPGGGLGQAALGVAATAISSPRGLTRITQGVRALRGLPSGAQRVGGPTGALDATLRGTGVGLRATFRGLKATIAANAVPPQIKSAALVMLSTMTRRIIDEDKPVVREDKRSAMRKELEGER